MNLHIRLTTACNAACTYCSCGPDEPVKHADLPTVDQVISGAEWLLQKTMPKGAERHQRIDLEVLGGEILLLPMDWLEACVRGLQDSISLLAREQTIGSQSNLIAGPKKITKLVEIFGTAIGTSTDNVQDYRQLAGSADNYREKNEAGTKLVADLSQMPGVVWTCTVGNEAQAITEYEIYAAQGRSLTIREVFQGANDVQGVDSDAFAEALIEVWNRWFLQGTTIVNPLYRTVQAILNTQPVGCPWWRSCAGDSINMDGNGDIYLCQEMNDVGLGKIGNVFRKEWDDQAWNRLALRRARIDRNCLSCDVYDLCQGGCMMDAWSTSGDIYARPSMCPAWKRMFRTLRQDIDSRDRQEVIKWIGTLI
ncbi:MAG: SPASM domain-containing protein [Candidatus Thiodiazotropha lotti]|nr:SPASM domain-containing protein [Candidatus Thiodiazotropha lotti]